MSQTTREKVVPLGPKPSPQPVSFPIEPLQATIRETVRSEVAAALGDVHQTVASAVDAQVRVLIEGARTVANDASTAATAAAMVGAQMASARGLLHAIAALLAIRLLLMMALLGGLLLAWRALNAGTYQACLVSIAYAILFVLPLVALEWSPRRPNKPVAVSEDAP
jgi:hypothetical protein